MWFWFWTPNRRTSISKQNRNERRTVVRWYSYSSNWSLLILENGCHLIQKPRRTALVGSLREIQVMTIFRRNECVVKTYVYSSRQAFCTFNTWIFRRKDKAWELRHRILHFDWRMTSVQTNFTKTQRSTWSLVFGFQAKPSKQGPVSHSSIIFTFFLE